jgi:hypothetical protein
VTEPIEARIRAAIRDRRIDGRLPPGAGIEVLAERAVAAGVIAADDAQALAAQRELVEQVIRVDDFDRDLGASLLQPAIDALHRQSLPAKPRAPAEPRLPAV